MANLSHIKCKNHAVREAVAKCMVCKESFCRECVVEHEGRMTCKHCLDEIVQQEAPQKREWFKALLRTGFALASFVLCYTIFYQIGRFLMSMAQTFYEYGQ